MAKKTWAQREAEREARRFPKQQEYLAEIERQKEAAAQAAAAEKAAADEKREKRSRQSASQRRRAEAQARLSQAHDATAKLAASVRS